jgi:hypothetical protein
VLRNLPANSVRISTSRNSQNKAEYLALGEFAGWTFNGVTSFELYTEGMSREHIARLKHDMAAWRPDVFDIDWSQILPADGPPPPIEIEDERKMQPFNL